MGDLRKTTLAGVLAMVVFAMINYGTLGYLERSQHEKLEQMRREIQGFWLLETTTIRTTKAEYQGIRITHLLTLTVDENLSLRGIAYKARERIASGEERAYRREDRARAEISGSVIQPTIILNWESNDSQGRSSIQTFEGSVSTENGHTLVRGNFFNDVANQLGTFCAKKVGFNALQNESLPTQICQP